MRTYEVLRSDGASVGDVYDLELLGGAPASPGDYCYRSGSLRWDVPSGMWGILRVKSHALLNTCTKICRTASQWWKKLWWRK